MKVEEFYEQRDIGVASVCMVLSLNFSDMLSF